jgi:Zn-dependent protease
MWKRRLVFNLIFFVGTLLAGIGWLSELREWRIQLGNLAVAGHAIQIAGAFGNLLTPDDGENAEDGRNDFEN